MTNRDNDPEWGKPFYDEVWGKQRDWPLPRFMEISYDEKMAKFLVPGKSFADSQMHWFMLSMDKRATPEERELAAENDKLGELLHKKEVSPQFRNRFNRGKPLVKLSIDERKKLTPAEAAYYKEYLEDMTPVEADTPEALKLENVGPLTQLKSIVSCLSSKQFKDFALGPNAKMFPVGFAELYNQGTFLHNKMTDPTYLPKAEALEKYAADKQKMLILEEEVKFYSYLKGKEDNLLSFSDMDFSVELTKAAGLVSDIWAVLDERNAEILHLYNMIDSLKKDLILKAGSEIYKANMDKDEGKTFVASENSVVHQLIPVDNTQTFTDEEFNKIMADILEVKSKLANFELVSDEINSHYVELEEDVNQLKLLKDHLSDVKEDVSKLNALSYKIDILNNKVNETEGLVGISKTVEKFKDDLFYYDTRFYEMEKALQKHLTDVGREKKENQKILDEMKKTDLHFQQVASDYNKNFVKVSEILSACENKAFTAVEYVDSVKSKITEIKKETGAIKKEIGRRSKREEKETESVVGRKNENEHKIKREVNALLERIIVFGGDESWLTLPYFSMEKAMPYRREFTTDQWRLQKEINLSAYYNRTKNEFRVKNML